MQKFTLYFQLPAEDEVLLQKLREESRAVFLQRKSRELLDNEELQVRTKQKVALDVNHFSFVLLKSCKISWCLMESILQSGTAQALKQQFPPETAAEFAWVIYPKNSVVCYCCLRLQVIILCSQGSEPLLQGQTTEVQIPALLYDFRQWT